MSPGIPQSIPPSLIPVCFLVVFTWRTLGGDPVNPLPPGVRAVWELDKAQREITPTRERVCINGLWRWQPAEAQLNTPPPAGNWGHFKVPGSWPGITDYMQKDSQTLHPHPVWAKQPLRSVNAAWYQREITVPATWSGRRVTLHAEYLNSYAAVFVDGKRAGEIRFPAGEVDVTALCRPGATHVVSLHVVALPLKGVMISYSDTATAKEVKGAVPRRGLCGDVYLVSTPHGPRLAAVRADTSVRRKEFTCGVTLENLPVNARHALRARITQNGRAVKEFTSPAFQAGDLEDGRVQFTEKWMPDKLWDIHTPQNVFDLEVSLLDSDGRALDVAWPARFGFREMWIDGRDFFLNGKRLFLSSVPLDNAQCGAAWSTYAAARESLERLQSFGVNFVYTHNYGCEPGSHLSFAEILRAADDAGMLVALSQPHFSHYDWQADDADAANGYARHAAFYAGVAGSHPSVVMYAMSHNATGYSEDMNPDMIDGLRDPRDGWSARNAKLALRAEAIVKRLDPARIVYHHASGNLGSMHPINFYPNFVPAQEMSDWFGHWATTGVKPVFLCEFAAPFTWDWTMYRGWYKGEREFGSARVPWEFCLAEWNAQFLGEAAYKLSEPEKTNLRWEARQFRAGNLWHRWDYPFEVSSKQFAERYPVFASYITDNWRAFRTWGVSAFSPWEHGHFWKLRDGADRGRKECKTDWDHLQRPGFSPDFTEQRHERMDLAYERADWIPTPAAEALLRNNRPLLAYIAGKPARFSSKDHNFLPGETTEKQLVIINNSRETVTCECEWTLRAPRAVSGRKAVTVEAGGQERIPFRFELPATLAPGKYELDARFQFSTGETQTDSFAIHVLSAPARPESHPRVALFDPKGETRALFDEMGAPCESLDVRSDLSQYDILVIGKAALKVDSPALDIGRVRDGLKVIVFEQTADVLEKRFGFRVAQYGLRQVFPRLPDHPVLAGMATENLRDWRGEATLLPPKLDYELRPRHGPTVQWCGLPVTRLWRCGNQGSVASVLIEKPTRGDFLPVLDGGFSLQYSPLMECREGAGVILFCQLDVTGRTETDPAAETITRNLLQYAAAWKPVPRRKAVYAGEAAGKRHLDAAGLIVRDYTGGRLSPDEVLVAGPGSGKTLTPHAPAIAEWLRNGGNLLALGLDQADASALPLELSFKRAEHISAFFDAPAMNSPFAGVSPADLHNRDPRELPLLAAGAQVLGNGVLARAQDANLVLCQMAPWQFEGSQSHLRRTHRRCSFLVTRLLANAGVAGATPLLERFRQPLDAAKAEQRWLAGLYLDQPEEWDDPYRFFRW